MLGRQLKWAKLLSANLPEVDEKENEEIENVEDTVEVEEDSNDNEEEVKVEPTRSAIVLNIPYFAHTYYQIDNNYKIRDLFKVKL